MRRPIVAAAVVLVGLLAGCSASSTGTSAPPTVAATTDATSSPQPPPPLDTCGGVTRAWTAVPGSTPAAATGDGPVVVFANQSGNRVCPWLDLAQALAGQGYRTVVFTYADSSAAGEKQSVDQTLAVARSAGGGTAPVALVGASLGGRVVIEAAARHPANLALIVSLSGEAVVEDYPDILPAAGQVTTPALYIGATDDPLTQGAAQQNSLHQAMHGQPNDILQVPGTGHGTALIEPPDGDNARTVAAIVAFLHDHLH